MPSSFQTPAPDSGDAEIVRLIRERDAGGVRQLLALHGVGTRAGLKKVFRDSLSATEIDEAMNSAAYNAWRAVDTYDPTRGSLRAWFFVIARNAGNTILRDRKRARFETRSEALDRVPASDEIASTPPHAFLETVRRCVASLPRIQRKIIEADLRNGDVADADELARKLRTSKNSIYASRSMARKALKQTLLEQGYVPGEGRSQELWN